MAKDAPKKVYYNPIFFVKLSLDNGEVVELQGSGELTQAMVKPYKSSLVSAEIGELCTSIGTWAFYSCKGLTNITIGSGVTSIGDQAFNSCTGLISITIPDSIISIGSFAFSYCRSLTSVSIPDSVTSIGVYAFNGCTGLTSITIPYSVTTINNYAFDSCEGLTSVTIGSGVTYIGNGVFTGCSSLTNIVVDSANTVYDSRDNCNAIINTSTNELIAGCKNTVIPNTVTSIGYEAFRDCKGLTSITIPDSVTSIGEAAFSGCSGLTSIVVDSGNTIFDSRDNCNAIINTSTNELMYGCKNTVIPSSVTSIGERAFQGCSTLTSITIPDSVTSIGHNAFYECTGLTTITSLATTAPTIEWGTFDRVQIGGTLTVPSGSTGYDEWMSYLDMYNWNMVEQ